ncbi:MAG: LacI family DNA-binding transcriptional regulator [Spirochaetia bacterium]|jgi:LacI family transcriptional regulator|nr:LacI family DNA-binding transcriptional regulator [Spirochaetia bacterium]
MSRATATVRDVARVAKVSTATVSRVLNQIADSSPDDLDAGQADGLKARTDCGEAGNGVASDFRQSPGASTPRVSPRTRARVLAAAELLDYRPNHVARSLKTRSTRTIAILAPELANDFFMELAESTEKELGKAGYMLLISSSSNSAEEEARRLRVLSQRLVDGIIVVPASQDGAHIQVIAEAGTPVVLVDRLVANARLDAVLADNEGGAREATRALLADGFTRISFVGGDPALTTARERLAGFSLAIAEAGLGKPDAHLGGMGIADGYRLMDSIMAEASPPQALFAVNLLVHLGMERRLLEEGRAALERFPMASFDETPYSPFMTACRYAVAQPAAEMGIAAARLILERIGQTGSHASGPDAPKDSGTPVTIRLPTTLIRHNLNASNQGINATHGSGFSPDPDIESVRRKEHG